MKAEQISREALKCINCGACLKNCPTYNSSYNEAESARGRFMTMHYLLENQYEEILETLKSCLRCGVCQDSCPISLPYLKCYSHLTETKKLFSNTELNELQEWIEQNPCNILLRDLKKILEDEQFEVINADNYLKIIRKYINGCKPRLYKTSRAKVGCLRNVGSDMSLDNFSNIEVIDETRGWFINDANHNKNHLLKNYEGAKYFVKKLEEEGFTLVFVEDKKIIEDLQRFSNKIEFFQLGSAEYDLDV